MKSGLRLLYVFWNEVKRFLCFEYALSDCVVSVVTIATRCDREVTAK